LTTYIAGLEVSRQTEAAEVAQGVVGSTRILLEKGPRSTKRARVNPRRRRVIGKAEYLAKGANPRFVVTNLPRDVLEAQKLYEQMYCARGDMENRIKEQQLYLFADRTSSATIKANQLRLYFSSLAYVLMNELRTQGCREQSLPRPSAIPSG